MSNNIRIPSFIFLTAIILSGCSDPHREKAQNDSLKFTTQSQYPFLEKQDRRLATGFFVSNEGHFVTSHHVTNGAKDVYITTSRGQRVSARVIQENPDIDVVLAKADVSSNGVALGTNKVVAKGGEVLTLGYPLFAIQGSEQKATFGRINAFSGIRGDPNVYQIDVPLQPGNSGGPLISENGVVIGVVKATFNQMAALQTIGTFTQSVNYAVKSDQILPMLQGILGDKLKVSSGSSPQKMPQLIRKFENSIVLVEAY